MSTIRNLTVEKNLEAPTEPLALIAFRLAEGELFGTVDVWLDVATDVNVVPALPAYLRELADQIERSDVAPFGAPLPVPPVEPRGQQ